MPTKTRSPMFTPVKTKKSEKFVLTARDLEILLWVARLRLATAEQVAYILDAPLKKISARMQSMFHKPQAYLSRSRTPMRGSAETKGTSKVLYDITHKGLKLLSEQKGFPKRRQPGIKKLTDHALGLSHFLVALVQGCKASNGVVDIVWPDQILAQLPTDTAAATRPFTWSAKIRQQVFRVESDYTIGLHFVKDQTVLWLPIEMDMGTETVMLTRHKTFGLTQADQRANPYYKKIAVYHQAWKDGYHKQRFSWGSFVMVSPITTPSRSPDGADTRIQTILEATKTHTGSNGSNLFVYLNWSQLVTEVEQVVTRKDGSPITYVDLAGKTQPKKEIVTKYQNPLTMPVYRGTGKVTTLLEIV